MHEKKTIRIESIEKGDIFRFQKSGNRFIVQPEKQFFQFDLVFHRNASMIWKENDD